MRCRLLLVPSLCVAAGFAQAADLGWSGAPGASPPAPWSVAAGDAIAFLDRAIEITAPADRRAVAVAAVDLPDGSDERPLRLSAVVSAWGAQALKTHPALVALVWKDGAVFAVGLGAPGAEAQGRRDGRQAWAVWAGGGQTGSSHGEAGLAAGASPAHLRLVLTSREVAAYASCDGWTWSRIAGLPRDRIGAAGAPDRVEVGRGQVRSGAAGLAADPPGAGKGAPCHYRFSDLRVEAEAPEPLPAAPDGYLKKDTLADTLAALAAAGAPRRWRIRGPEQLAEPPELLPPGFAGDDGWRDHELGEGERFLQLGQLLPGAGSRLRWAATELTTGAAGWLRFRFDGLRRCWLWVDGRLLAAPGGEVAEAEIDRLAATAWLPAGTHAVVLAVRSSDGRAAATLRWENGDPRWRISLLRRLALDFPGDELLADAPFEQARLWEGLGFARAAAAALSVAATAQDPERSGRARGERARLFHLLGDAAAATAETAALQQQWAADGADALATARRTARLWQRLDAPGRALGVLDAALALPGLGGETRCDLRVERARLRHALGDVPGAASELRAAAACLAEGDPARRRLLDAAQAPGERPQDDAAGELFAAGRADEALARLQLDALGELDAVAAAGIQLRQADLWLAMGFPRRAAAALVRARETAPGAASIDREADRRSRSLLGVLGEQVAIAVPFELTTLLRTAERALATDAERAAQDFQQIIDGPGDQAIQLADGSWRGAAEVAANRLRGSGAAVQAAWRERHAARAAGALARLGDDELVALSGLARRWPLAAAAGEALGREAARWSARGAWQLARGTALRCLAEHPDLAPGPLLLRAAHAAARLGDAAGLDGLLARLTALGQTLPWDGRQLPPHQLADALRGLLPPPLASAPAPAALLVSLPPFAQAMRQETVAVARPPLPAALLIEGGLVVATPDDLAGLAVDGSVRWCLPAQVAGGDVAGSAVLAVDGGVVLAGLRRGGSRQLVAVEAASGRQLWTSATIPALAGADLASAPTLAGGLAWACFSERGRGFVACLDAQDGTVRWQGALAGAPSRQVAAGDAPAPALHGRELFVAADTGQISAFDALDGRLLWLHLYERSAIDANRSPLARRRLMARGRGVILADAERVYVAPRDTLGILALDRAGGGLAWAAPLAEVDELSALTPAGVVALGPAISLHDPASGALRWRWIPAGGERPGRPAVAGAALWVPLGAGPTRLDLADGSSHQGPAWSALGLDGPAPTALQAAAGALLALGDGLVVRCAAAAAKPLRVEIASRSQPIVGTAVPSAADATALALRWHLPIGTVSRLDRPAGAQDGETYAVAAGRLHRLDALSGRIAWTLALPGSGLRELSVAGTWLLLVCDGQMSVHERASGRLLWRGPAAHGQAQLAGDVVLRWTAGASGLAVCQAADGAALYEVQVEGGICGVVARGDELQVLVIRGKAAVMEIRRLADGGRSQEVQLGLAGLAGLAQASLLRLPDGAVVIASPAGGVLWDAGARQGVRFDPGMDRIHTAWRDGAVLNLVGLAGQRHRSVFLDPSGALLGQDEFAQRDQWQDRLRLAPRWIAGVRVQVASRQGQTGYLIRRPDGGEQAWLPVREEWRRHVYALLPWGAKAIAFASDKDGWLRAQQLDPAAGRIELESTFGLSMVERVQPLAVSGGILVPTTGGVVSIVPVAGPSEPLPGRALAESNQTIRRLGRPLVVDGRLDEWEGQAAVQAGPLAARLGWRDDALAIALSIPAAPSATRGATLAIEAVRGEFAWQTPPLQIALAWQGGVGRARVLHSPVAQDALRPPVQARLASDGLGQTWELLIPWSWLYPGSERPRREHGLRFGTAVERSDPPGSRWELGAGLGHGLDKAGLIRLRLVDGSKAGG